MEDYKSICFEMLLIAKNKEKNGQNNKKSVIKVLNIPAKQMELKVDCSLFDINFSLNDVKQC